ncbi:MAG: YceI family protein [Chitinophagales bacterium]|nr:YceI family protein [Chitinophagales bacterium]
MKKILMIATAVVFMIGTAFSNPGSDATEFSVDTEKSKVLWTGSKVTGSHNGTISLSDGSVWVKGSSVNSTDITIDMNSIVCLDIENEGTNQKLVGHLKSDDFFGVKTHPEAMFNATKFIPIKGAKDGEANHTIVGNLTIKGITHEISFPAVVIMKNDQLMANGTATIDRSKWNVQYGSGSFFDNLGDKMIYDDFDITFNLVATSASTK